MNFTRKIHIANKPLILTNDAAAYRAAHRIAGGYLQLSGAFPRQFRLALQHLEQPGTLGAIIEDIAPDALLRELYSIYEPINAAGGVVVNEEGGVLLIYRRGKWDLPKGKQDEGEDIAACALREVTEETGLNRLQLGEKICDTWHTYTQKKQSLLKQTSWYRMTGTSAEPLIPQAEEHIQEARWFSPEAIRPILFKTYDAIKEVLQESGIHW